MSYYTRKGEHFTFFDKYRAIGKDVVNNLKGISQECSHYYLIISWNNNNLDYITDTFTAMKNNK